jgi:uncharacterized protein
MGNVYWIKGRSQNIHRSIMADIDALFRLNEFSATIHPDATVAIKFNFSEMGYGHYLPPVILTTLFEKARNDGAKPVLTDGGSLFKGSRHDGYSWNDALGIMGYSNGELFQNQIMQTAGYTSEEGNFWPADGEHLAGVDIGSLITDASHMIVVSHVTAHPLLGLGGALYNLGLGLLTNSGKLKIHGCLEVAHDKEKCDSCGVCLSFCPTGALSNEDGKVVYKPQICNRCLGCLFVCPHDAIRIEEAGIAEFQETVAEAAQAVLNRVRGNTFFINFIKSVTPQTDEYPFSDVPFIPDLGIIGSDDPVAADWATTQMIKQSPGVPGSVAQDMNVLEKGSDKLKAITGQSPEHMLTYAEQIGLGSRQFDMLTNQ